MPGSPFGLANHNDKYVPAFDGLRGVAILPVLLLHVGVGTLADGPLLGELTRGWYGVDLFFVLSGFLITWILLGEIDATGTIDVRRFYVRRALRLAPAYLSMLVAVLLGAAIFEPRSISKVPAILPSLLTYTYNYQVAAQGRHFDVIVVIWSLCIEEQFYLVWPWILRWLGTRRSLQFCAGAIIVLTAYRTGLYVFLNWRHLTRPSSASSIWIYFATDTRISVILTGCFAALSLRSSRAVRVWEHLHSYRAFPLTALAVAIGCAVFVTGGEPSSGSWRSATFGYTVCAAAAAVLIVAVFTRRTSLVAQGLGWRPLVALGSVSYGVYLFHPAVAWLWFYVAGTSNVFGGQLRRGYTGFAIASILIFAMSWAIATLHYRYVERRFMALRAPRPQAAATSADSQKLDAPAASLS